MSRYWGRRSGARMTVQENSWTFFTNHAHVLVCLSRDSDLTLREVAAMVGITERATQRIVADLESAGILERSREGRRNHYTIDPAMSLRHDIEKHCTVGELLDFVGPAPGKRRA